MTDRMIMPETARGMEYVIASYYIELAPEQDVVKKAESLAVGQTIGTWVPVPGITDEIREKYMGRVVQIFDVPPAELKTDVPAQQEKMGYLIRIAYPAANFGTDFALMMTALLGNDASTSAQVKLMDIEFPDGFLREFPGPRYGIRGLRERFGIWDRPLFLNMIKPCTGLTPEEGSRIFYETARGGADLIKDDELFGNPVYSRPADRVRAFRKAADRAFEETGHRTRYIVNVTCGIRELEKNVREAEEAGADGVLFNFAILGYSALRWLRDMTELPILGHCAGVGVLAEGAMSGMATPLAAGKLARIAGADTVMVNTPYSGYPLRKQKYLQICSSLTGELKHIAPSMPIIGGGVHPGIVKKYIGEVGKDIILAAGGAVQGHPGGAAHGAKAMRDAIDLACSTASDEEFLAQAGNYPELAAALARWPYVS